MSFSSHRVLHIFVAALLMLQSFGAWAQPYVGITAREAHMRVGPGTQHAVQWRLSRGYPLQVIARRGAWLKVRDFEHDSGWVHRRVTGKSTHKVVRAPVANLRSQPRIAGRLLGRLERGDIVKRLARRGDWVRVERDGGLRGWVAARLLWGG
jgi:SH3-like domain-containing protein